MRTGSENVIFWGAGATASLGLSTTADQAKKINFLLGGDRGDKDVLYRCNEAIRHPDWAGALADLLLVLGDGSSSCHKFSEASFGAMQRNWADSSLDALRARMSQLREIYDWPALREVAKICPRADWSGGGVNLTDLFNIIDLHAQSFHGFRAGDIFLPPHRLVAARRALQLILNAVQFIEWHLIIPDRREELFKHWDFAQVLAERHQRIGLELAAQGKFLDTRDFYLGDVAFVSLNYDPTALWSQFIANREANLSPPQVGLPCVPLKIFHDFGIFMAVSTIGKNSEKEKLWYPLNEASAQRINDTDHISSRRVRINKFLMPHGCLCWRECPSCGKLTAYMGKAWEIDSPTLLPPPPLRRFAELAGINSQFLALEGREEEAWQRGEVDVRACVHCGELTEAQHTQNIQQSSFKQTPPSFIQEVQRDMRVVTQSADHIILLGYSLPADDVLYRAFFAARKSRPESNNPVRCSVVVGAGYEDRWYAPEELDGLLSEMDVGQPPKTTLEAARSIFGPENVRFYGGGFPSVISVGGRVTAGAVDRLLNYSH